MRSVELQPLLPKSKLLIGGRAGLAQQKSKLIFAEPLWTSPSNGVEVDTNGPLQGLSLESEGLTASSCSSGPFNPFAP